MVYKKKEISDRKKNVHPRIRSADLQFSSSKPYRVRHEVCITSYSMKVAYKL